jgi:hypothetical protein
MAVCPRPGPPEKSAQSSQFYGRWAGRAVFPILPKTSDFDGWVWPIPSIMATSAWNIRRGSCVGWLAVVAILSGLTSGGARGALADAPGLPEIVRTKHRSFAIPFRLPASQDPDADAAAQRVVLNVSKDLGATWSAAGETSPTAGSFSYTADVDGEYWFRLRAIDTEGRSRGGEGPDIRVLVDAAGPRLAARLWKGTDGEIVCRYAAADDSLRLDSLTLEYRGVSDRGWKSVAADAVLAREAPAHLVGEAIWWAGEKVEQLTVRIAVSDSSGNQTVKQFSLEPSDPGVDQSALAGELGLPPLPSADGGGVPPAPMTREPAATEGAPTRSVLAPRGPTGPGWAPEAASWQDDSAAGRSPRKATAAGLGSRGPATTANLPLPTANRSAHLGASDETASLTMPAGNSPSEQPVGGQAEYRGRPLHFSASCRFAWDYEVPAVRRTAGPLRAELWTTRDGGVTWQRAATDTDGRSPIDVELTAAGLYGVRLELVADVPDAEAGPRSGAEPDAWLGIDEEPPQIELIDVGREDAASGDALVIRYAARDPLLASNAVRLLYSPNAEGPWATIVAGVANEGEHRWEPARNVPARVYVRVEASDAAGNAGFAVSDQPVSIAPTRFGGRLGGLRVLPAP